MQMLPTASYRNSNDQGDSSFDARYPKKWRNILDSANLPALTSRWLQNRRASGRGDLEILFLLLNKYYQFLVYVVNNAGKVSFFYS